MGRRQFAKILAIGGISLGTSFRMVHATDPSTKNTICAFTKPLQSLSFAELAQTMAAIGYDGVEFAVRFNGHITPDQVEDQLPRVLDALREHGLELTIMTRISRA